MERIQLPDGSTEQIIREPSIDNMVDNHLDDHICIDRLKALLGEKKKGNK